jgi:hypothetical protein
LSKKPSHSYVSYVVGVYHVILHNMYGCNTGIGSRPCGTHGFSVDGWQWTLSGTGAYSEKIEMTTDMQAGVAGDGTRKDGSGKRKQSTTTFVAHSRERPHLVLAFAADGSGRGSPTHLITGTGYDRDASFTVVQPLRLVAAGSSE